MYRAARIRFVAPLVLLAALAPALPVRAAEPDAAGVVLRTCRSPSAAQTVGRVEFLRVGRASCRFARRIAASWDALCRSGSEPRCVLRTRRSWRCVSAAAADERLAVRCLSGRRHVRFLWAG